MITEDYVSFETAKLLKEKGFNEDSWFHYDTSRYIVTRGYRLNHPDDIPAWTLQMVMKWLRKMYDLYIMLDFERPNCIEYKIYKYESELAKRNLLHYNYEESYEEACEAAIKYCLENLI